MPLLTTGAGAYRAIGGAAYVGPGDVQSGAGWFGGLRGYNAAYSTGSNPAIDIVDQAGAHSLTVNILSNGTLDVASIATWVATFTVTTIKVPKVYDQTAGALHATQATLSAMPTLELGPVTGLASNRPALRFTAANSQRLVSANVVVPVNQPITLSDVTNRVGSTGAANGIATLGGNILTQFSATTTVQMDAGSTVTSSTVSNNAWHALQCVANGASSVINLDGVDSSTQNVGATAWSGAVFMGDNSFSNVLDGYLQELGVYPVSFTTVSKSSAMNSNQKAYWGF